MKFLGFNINGKSLSDSKLMGRHILRVGIIGGSRGTGVTHLALMAGNYYANGIGCSTAVAECSGHRDFMRICDETNNMAKDIRHFSYRGIDFCTCGSSRELSKLFTGEYEAVVCDMANDTENGFAEFIRCDVRVVVCSTEIYKVGRTRKLLERLEDISVLPVAFAPDRHEKKRLEKRYGIRISEVPTETNPLSMQTSTLDWMRSHFPY